MLEFAGEEFAADLGICDYADPIHHVYKHCQRHNMLVPAGLDERPHPLRPLPVDVKPEGTGDARRFQARIDAAPGWRPYYRRWVRAWDSPAPDTLVIRDEYALAQGAGVDFLWQTLLPCALEGETAVIRGERGIARIGIPPGCTARVEALPLVGGATQNRLAIHMPEKAGALEVRVLLEVTP